MTPRRRRYFFDWSETISQFFFVFRVALFDVDVVEPTCAFEWGFNEAYRMMLSLPFAFAVVQAAAYALRFKSGDEAYAGTLSFFVEAQASLLYYCISTFICRKIRPGNRNVYVEDPDTSCATESSTTMQIIAVFYLLLILVVTLMLFQRLWTAASADELRSPHILARYGFLYRRLRMGAGFWWAVRMAKQAALVAILAWWSDPEDQAIFALLVLTTFAVFHALVRPETDRQVNRTEIYGVGISIFVVCLGLAFTAHARSSTGAASRKTDLRYVGYFGFAQILFLLYACYATATNIAAIRARAEVVDRVQKLHGAVLRARRRSSDLHLSDGFSSTSLRDPSPQLPGFRNKLARGIDRLRGGKSLTHTQALDLRGYENAVADSGGQLEVLNTFRGPPLKAYVRDTGTEGSDALALTRFVSLNRDLAPTVADTSPVGNFSRRHEAYCFHQLGHALPSLVDYALSCDRGRRASLAGVISDVVAFDDNRSMAGAQSISDVLVEPIDVPSLLHYSVNASEREVNTLRGVVDGLVAATPRLHAQAEAVRARTRIAVRVQRAWRRRRRVYEAA